MHGRGTLDMKGIAVCQLAAFLDVARSGKRPERDIALLATADEETGSANGMAWLVAHRPDLFAGIRYSIGEGGITEMVAEKPTYFSIEIGPKQYARLLLESESEEALRRARFALEPYAGAREPERILPEVRRYFQFVAPTRVSYGRELADIDGAVARGKFWILPVAYRNLTQIVVGMEWPRREQGRWRANVHILMLPDDEPAARVEWARRLVAPFGVRVTAEVLEPRTPLSSDVTPMFRLIAGEAEREYHAPAGTLILHRSSNDSRFLRRRGIDCYGVSPYLVDAFESATIHGVDEQVALDRFVRGVALMRRIVGTWASGR
jgi:acetylornithine deacetylase/succinyl-diaminopimelate desuccinylase-like protein